MNAAEALYRERAWGPFLENVSRGRALASSPGLQQRLSREVDFAEHVMEAEKLEERHSWSAAADGWQQAAGLFPTREWVTMKSSVAWLLADDLPRAVPLLAVLAAQSESATALQARALLADLLRAFPALELEARDAAQKAQKGSGVEFEVIKREE